MKKRGFTLVELLGVIVVISLILLIAVPVINITMDKSRLDAIKNNVNHYVATLEQEAELSENYYDDLDLKYIIGKNGDYTVNGETNSIDMKGHVPEDGIVCLNKTGNATMYSLYLDGYTINMSENNVNVYKGHKITNLPCNAKNNIIMFKKSKNFSTCSKTKTIEITYPAAAEVDETLTKEYRIDNGEWQTYRGSLSINKNETIYARVRNIESNIVTIQSSLVITKVDNEEVSTTKPVLTLSTSNPTKDIIATFRQTDNCNLDDSTIEYGYYDIDNSKWVWQSSNKFNDMLNDDKHRIYRFKTRANDIAGNGLTESEEETIEIGGFGTITFNENPSTWSSSKTVSVSGTTTGAELQVRYVRYDPTNDENIDSGYSKYTNPVNVTDMCTIEHPCYVYARLWDGKNASKTAQRTIYTNDITAPDNVSLSATTFKTERIILKAVCSDKESPIAKYEFRNGTGNFVNNENNDTYEFTGLNKDSTYDFYVRCTNEAGLSTVSEVSTGKTENITSNNVSIERDNNNWATSHVFSVTYSDENIANAYYFVKSTVDAKINIAATACGANIRGTTTSCSGDSVAAGGTISGETWYKVAENANVTLTANGTVYAAVTDGTNIIDPLAQVTTSKVDTDPPTIKTVYAGGMLYTDPTFASGNNSIVVYNNKGSGTVTHTRKSMTTPEGSYALHIKTTAGETTPGLGGFTFRTQTAKNKVFVTRIVAKIPTGYTLNWHSNSTGTNGTNEWLTDHVGTGDWEEYINVTKCGASGTFSDTNYFALSGAAATSSAPVEWDIAYATVIDTTKWGQKNYVISAAKDTQSGIVNYLLNTSSSSASFGTNFTAKSNRGKISEVTSNGTKYAWYKDGVGRTNKGSVSVDHVDTTAPTISWAVDTANSTSGSNGWYKALTMKGTITESQSGVASVIYCITTASTCTPLTSDTLTVSSNTVTKAFGSNASAQRICAKVTDNAGNASTVTCSSTYKVDVNDPSITWAVNTANSTSGSNGWYKALTLKATITEAHSGISSIKYCTGTADCTPGTAITASNNVITLPAFGSNASAQKACAIVTDTSGRSKTVCSSAYKVDVNDPGITVGTVTSANTTVTIPYTASDSHSKVASVKCEYGTSTSYGKSVNGSSTASGNCSITGLKYNTTYYYRVTVTDTSGRTKASTGSKKTTQSSTIYVKSTGTDGTGCGTSSAPCKTIQQGVTEVASGGTIALLSNITLSSTINISKSLTLKGNGTTVYSVTRASSFNTTAHDMIFIGGSKTNVKLQYITINGNNVAGQNYCIAIGTGSGAGVASGATLDISTSATIQNCVGTYQYSGGAILLQGSNTVTLNGGTIKNNKNTNNGQGGAIKVTTGATFTMNSGTISGNSAPWGGAIKCDAANINIKGGTISGNTSSGSCGAIAAGDNTSKHTCKITMSGGTITTNKANSGLGGGICLYHSSTLTMSNGTISSNTASGAGGGVYVSTSSSFTMTGGNITSNSGGSSGGVYANESGTFTLNGGNIKSNKAVDTKGVAGGIGAIAGKIYIKSGTVASNTASDNCQITHYSKTTYQRTGGTVTGNVCAH